MLWFFCLVFSLVGLRYLGILDGRMLERMLGLRSESRELGRVILLFHELQDTLEAGLVPEPAAWHRLKKLHAPWGQLGSESLEELRSQGAPILPTLRRIRDLAAEHQAALKEARSRSAQALAQSWVCAAMVPVFGLILYGLLPGIEQRPLTWGLLCLGALAVAGTGGVWLLEMADRARWGGLAERERPWVLAAQCAGERFLALVRSGTPPDQAWIRACSLLPAELGRSWGYSVWKDSRRRAANPLAEILIEAGTSMRKAIQVSLMEGRPCAERIESVLQGLRRDVRSQMERELQLLGARALKPLFLCVAPALIGLLGSGLYLGWEQIVGF